MADQRWSDIQVVFTKILCSRSVCVWYVTKLKFTGYLQMASLSFYFQFETNLMSNRKVIKLLLQLKRRRQRFMVKTTWKSNYAWSAIFCVIVYWLPYFLVKNFLFSMFFGPWSNVWHEHPCTFLLGREGGGEGFLQIWPATEYFF